MKIEEQILQELHKTMQRLIDDKDYNNCEILAGILNFLIESVAILDFNEKDILEFINRDFVKNVKKMKKLYKQ